MTRRTAVILTSLGISGFVSCKAEARKPNLADAAWQLYVSGEDSSRSFRCNQCGKMQPDGSFCAMVADSIQIGDSLDSVRDVSRRSGHFSGWCGACFAKLLAKGGAMPQPGRAAYVPPSAEEIHKQREESIRWQEEQRKFQAEYDQNRRDLYWALRTRVLSDEEMEKVRSMDYSLVVQSGQSFFEKDKKEEFRAALEGQFRMQLAAKEAGK